MLTENDYNAMKKSPIIYFNGPFEPCYGMLKKKGQYRLNREVAETLYEVSRGATSGLEYLVKKSKRNLLGGIESTMRRNSVLKKRERKYYEEIKKKLN
jgi:hypothetical protein